MTPGMFKSWDQLILTVGLCVAVVIVVWFLIVFILA